MQVLSDISDALDRNSLSDIRDNIETLRRLDYESFSNSLKVIIQRFISMEIKECDRDEFEQTFHNLIGLLSENESRDELFRIIYREGGNPAAVLASKLFLEKCFKLDDDESKVLIDKIYVEEIPSVSENCLEWTNRIAYVLSILRRSLIDEAKISEILDSCLEASYPYVKIKYPLEFVRQLSIVDEFHPLVVIRDVSPNVFSKQFSCESIIQSFISFLSKWSMFREEDSSLFFPLIEKVFELTQFFDFNDKHVGLFADFWSQLIPMSNGIELNRTHQLVRHFNQCSDKFQTSSRCIYLKRILQLISSNKTATVAYEPQIVAIIIDAYRRYIKETEFQEELGEVWSIIYSLRYDNIYNSTVYYTSLFTLARAQALFGIKPALLKCVKDDIMKPIYEQIVDFKKMKDNKTVGPMDQHDNLGQEMFDLIVYSYQEAIHSIDNCLTSR